MKKFSVLILLALLVFGVSNASATLLTNGSFELPAGAGILHSSVGMPVGWSQTLSNSSWVLDQAYGPVSDGVQLLQGDATPATPMDIYQVLNLTPGNTYTVSLDYEGAGTTSGIRIDDIVGGSPVTIANAAYPGGPTYQSASFNFTVSAGATATEVHVLGLGGYNHVDNVQVTPEPATLVMLSIGAVLVARKRRSR